MTDFESLYSRLNSAQRQAVDTIDGPLLVIAGPGTGKTQLLSARVANILRKTDTLPQNILCLTFTESGAENMRERLTRFIGQSAYDVTISTYHGFGSDIINRFPQYFTETQLQNPVDQLGKHEILRSIVEQLSYLNPLKQLQHHLGDLITTVSEVKRALLTANDLRQIGKQNQDFILQANMDLLDVFAELSAASRITAKSIPLFEQISSVLAAYDFTELGSVLPLHNLAAHSLEEALRSAKETGKTTTLTAWKNDWLVKNEQNRYIIRGDLENRRIAALADVFEQYEAALHRQGLYDFDDMIIRAKEAMEQHDDLKYTLQEQYLYIMLDEFQDTNAAQLRLVELLTDNPVHEGRPNVMAVGDDDQAIYAFQGAEYSNMVDFSRLYRDVAIVNLTENYRSHQDIISTAIRVADQIEARLTDEFHGIAKTLVAKNTSLPQNAQLVRQELASDVAQYGWIAHQINSLIKSGTKPREIAVLAPKHRYLEPLVAHLNELDIPVQYEKRENILDAPIIKQLLTMCRLVLALSQADHRTADSLWPEVLSYDFWQIPVRTIWQLSWDVYDTHDETNNWTRRLLEVSDCAEPALLFASLALRTQTDSCEVLLDALIGSSSVKVNDGTNPEVRSPLRDYYTSETMRTEQPEIFYEAITQLKVLQTKLREHQSAVNRTLLLADLITFIEMYEAADEQMLNTSPYHQQADAVQLMTVFKAKGLEFEHVFLPTCHNDVWGQGSKGNRNNLTLPDNLTHIRHAGSTDDERLRILFVAITRAKFGLYLTSYSRSFSGSATKRLKYFDEQEQDDGSFLCRILPERSQQVLIDSSGAPAIETIELDWRSRHIKGLRTVDLHALLQQRLKNYQLSPTHLNQFVDLVHAGPEEFMFKTLLRFPQAPSVSGQYGNAIHETLEWVQYQTDEHQAIPSIAACLGYFKQRMQAKRLTDHELAHQIERGEHALRLYLAERGKQFKPGDKAEHNFAREGVFVGESHLTGKIDRLEIDKTAKTITVVDYKTGKPHQKWSASELSLHKYRQQLYCYKLLIEGSHTFSGYTVKDARLEFIEPDSSGKLYTLPLIFDVEETERTKQLIAAVWRSVTGLNLPDTRVFSPDVKGMIAFENWLLSEQQEHI